MKFELYPYQKQLVSEVYTAWAQGKKNILLALPTGGGKTVIIAEIIRQVATSQQVLAIAHRQELVVQLSCALARNEISHRIVGPFKLIRLIQAEHTIRYGRVWVDPRATVTVASVQTLARRLDDAWLRNVSLWITDEAHHLQTGNQWGRVVEALGKTARGLGPTATPYRADNKGLDQIFDALVVGPSPRTLIEQGYLTDYVIYSPTVQDLRLETVPVGASGDYVRQKLKKAVRGSQYLVGNIVDEYSRRAPGKLGATFATDLETAGDIVNRYRSCGIPAEIISAKTPADVRASIIRRFEARQILQLVTVDIISEGFDLPALEVASMARPTESRALCHQQFGRILRRADGKDKAILIDHVGNMLKHLPPEYIWDSLSLAGERAKKKEENPVPIKACPMCTRVYERYRKVCPYCGYAPEPQSKSTRPEEVDGDLQELTREKLLELIGLRNDVDRDPEEIRFEMQAKHAPAVGVFTAVKRHKERQDEQAELRDLISWFGGYGSYRGLDVAETQRLFYVTFGIDVLSAQGLKLNETRELKEQLRHELIRLGVEVGNPARGD